MDDNQTETQFIRNCLVMSFDELGIFTNDCLEQLEKRSNSDTDFPKQERTYNELISLLEKKIRDNLKTPEISKYLQDFREKNSYYSKSNNKYEAFTKSVESFLESLEQIKSKFKALESSEIPNIDILANIIKTKIEQNYEEIFDIVDTKVISDEMHSCILETLLLLQQNKEFSVSARRSENEYSFPLLKSFGKLGSAENSNKEKNTANSFSRLDLNYILHSTIDSSIFHLRSPWNPHISRNAVFYQSWLTGLRCRLIENSTNFIDETVLYTKNKAQYELEKYERQIQTDSTILQKELESKISREEDLIYGKPLDDRRKLIISLRSKKKNAFRKIFEKVKFEIIPFDIFPKGSIEISTFLTMLRSSGMCISYEDEKRLYKIAEKFPNYQSICRGRNDFDGFIVFRFEDTDVVIVEKPSYGNATYLVKGDWQKDVIKILQLSRSEARKHYSKQVKRVIHTSEQQWLSELEFKFKYWF